MIVPPTRPPLGMARPARPNLKFSLMTNAKG
jgi:hypothetical protein